MSIENILLGAINDHGYLTVGQFAEATGLSEWWTRELCRQKKLLAQKIKIVNFWIIKDNQIKKYQK